MVKSFNIKDITCIYKNKLCFCSNIKLTKLYYKYTYLYKQNLYTAFLYFIFLADHPLLAGLLRINPDKCTKSEQVKNYKLQLLT